MTKGFPFTGDVEDHKDDILGYKDGNEYYQWAVLKIVGMDVPLVLDAIPRKRGQSKDEIVDELLSHATEMVSLDLLVKIGLDGEHSTYKPRVDANLFLTVAKQCYGLDPPD